MHGMVIREWFLRLKNIFLPNIEKTVFPNTAIGGWITLGKKDANANPSAVSPREPFACIW